MNILMILINKPYEPQFEGEKAYDERMGTVLRLG